MSRKAKTKTIGGGSSVTVSKTLPASADIMARVEQIVAAAEPQDGEYDRAALLEKFKGNEAALDKFMRENKPHIVRRQIGRNSFLYRWVDEK